MPQLYVTVVYRYVWLCISGEVLHLQTIWHFLQEFQIFGTDLLNSCESAYICQSINSRQEISMTPSIVMYQTFDPRIVAFMSTC